MKDNLIEMKVFFSLSLIWLAHLLNGQGDVFDTWVAVDDDDGQPTSHIEIFEKEGNLHGKIVKIIEGPSDALCDQCKGEKHNQPILGMEIIWDMKDHGKNWRGGRIMDPENGKTYKCKIKLKEDVLEVRGFIGITTLGRTQKWYRLNQEKPAR